ncbi:MAG TPA: HAD family hydrolase [Allosphingosinicella sp.]|nr:HAD family hydrolase [Allosphingosinicella sp.]
MLDLDDTLYPERDYVRSGFAFVGQQLFPMLEASAFFDAAWGLFEQGHRGRIFDAALAALGIAPDAALIEKMVAAYRGHHPQIGLYSDAADFLRDYPVDGPLAMITDGPVASQSAKIAALGLASRFNLLVLTDRWGSEFRKPHERGFVHVERQWPGIPASGFTYVADNPLKDFVTPKARGWRTIRIAREGGEHRHRPMAGLYAADTVISDFGALRPEFAL